MVVPILSSNAERIISSRKALVLKEKNYFLNIKKKVYFILVTENNQSNIPIHNIIFQENQTEGNNFNQRNFKNLYKNSVEEFNLFREEFMKEVYKLRNGPFFLPPQNKIHEGMKTLFVDLDETLVHSSFVPVQNADYILPVT